MKEMKADLFKIANGGEAICITTNGLTKKDGKAVMGAGVAKAAREKYRGIDERLGKKLKENGNHVYALGCADTENGDGTYIVFSFPTKNNWRDNSSLSLIIQSCKELISLCRKHNVTKCYIPRPGCSNGHLDWETQVKPAIQELLSDDFVVVYN